MNTIENLIQTAEDNIHRCLTRRAIMHHVSMVFLDEAEADPEVQAEGIYPLARVEQGQV